MSFLVKLDENLSRSHLHFLRALGYSADNVLDEGLSGAKDSELWRKVVEESRFLITLDLDFSDLRRFPPGTHPGILLVRPSRNSRDAVQRVLSRTIQAHPLSTLTGCLAVADDWKTRIRRPPQDP